MILAYSRLNKFEDARRSILRMLDFARRFRMDNPLTNFGSEVYQPKEPINITVDAFAPMAAFVRGLFEYIYRADSLTLYPHIPAALMELHQKDPIRFGTKKLFLSTFGAGPISLVRLNGVPWKSRDAGSITLPYADVPDEAAVEIYLGSAKPARTRSRLAPERSTIDKPVEATGPERAGNTAGAAAVGPGPVLTEEIKTLDTRLAAFHKELTAAGLGETYAAAHARLVHAAIDACRERRTLFERGTIATLPAESREAADRAYIDTALKLGRGLDAVLKSYKDSPDAQKASIYAIYIRGEKN